MKKIMGYTSFILFLSVFSAGVLAAEPADQGPDLKIYHATNVGGLTGLFYTNSAYTVPKGKFEIGTSVLMERSGTPSYSLVQIPINVTYGLTNTIELGLANKVIYLNTVGQGIGDMEISAKWRVSEPAKFRPGIYLPAVAFGVGFILPTGSAGLNEVNNWGIKAMFMLTSEGTLSNNRYIGTYLDAQVIGKDLGSTSPLRDIYLVLNLGVVLPWQDDRNLQLIGEINVVSSKNTVTLGAASYNGITLGLRYASGTVKLSTGVQFLNKVNAGYNNTTRILVMASIEL